MGLGSAENSIGPTTASAIAIYSQNSEACVIFDNGETWCQYYDNTGNLATVNQSFPAPNNYPVKHISGDNSGEYCLVLENSVVFCGDPASSINGTGWEQLNLPADKIVVSIHMRQGGYPISSNYDTICAVFTDGSASCRGDNGYGQVGTVSTSSTGSIFQPVYFPQGISS